MKRIRTLRGLSVALTGYCSEPRYVMARLLKQSGARLTDARARVTQDTNLLVRGTSTTWKYHDYGRKEAYAEKLIRLGQPLSIILSADLDRLLEGHAVDEYPYVAGHDISSLRSGAEISKRFPTKRRLPKGPLEKGIVVDRRLEQALLRFIHFGDRTVAACSLCDRSFPTSLLVVGHIKRRSYCSAKEKRDIQNIAMPLCLLGCDEFYERGFLTVSPQGKVVTSKRSFRSADLAHALSQLSGRRCLAHRPATEPYFAWHRENMFMTTSS